MVSNGFLFHFFPERLEAFLIPLTFNHSPHLLLPSALCLNSYPLKWGWPPPSPRPWHLIIPSHYPCPFSNFLPPPTPAHTHTPFPFPLIYRSAIPPTSIPLTHNAPCSKLRGKQHLFALAHPCPFRTAIYGRSLILWFLPSLSPTPSDFSYPTSWLIPSVRLSFVLKELSQFVFLSFSLRKINDLSMCIFVSSSL